MKIAFIGTGVMGAPMALNLAKASYDVSVYNRTYQKAKKLEPQVVAYDNLLECIKDKDVIFTIVGYPNDVKEVYQTIIPHAKKGAILIDMTTSSPSLAKELSLLAEEHDLSILDAPVTGGDIGAVNGTLSIMVGGSKEAYLKAYPLFEVLGSTISYMGESGNGQYTKLANQIAIAGAIGGLAEALSFSKNKNLDSNEVLKILNSGSASSNQSKINGPKMISGNFEPTFFIKHYLKDLELAIKELDGIDLDILKHVKNVYKYLSELGDDNLGIQAIIKYYLHK
ncbi:NAD(P)-dependent oxidoreductase [Acholeplasma sp. OttesenSCG-928-E16]|nr:NAD(P)-dependent oxidoreductase [Acholeplasma sp. OttesenSCG-928-E16]